MKLFLFFLALPVGPAMAADGPCVSGARIFAQTQHCEENGAYVKQAETCRTQLEKEVARVSERLKLSLLSTTGAAAQSAQLGQSVQDYAATVAQLDRLILLSGAAIKDVNGYLDVVVLPEDIENPEITGGNPQRFADSVPCYSDTVKGINAEIAKLTKIQNELKASRKQSADHAATSSASQGGLTGTVNEAASAPVPATKGQGAGASVKRGSSSQGASDISGTERLQKKPPAPKAP